MPKKTGPSTPPETDLSRFEESRWGLPRCFIIHAWSPPAFRHVINSIRHGLKDWFHLDVDLDFGQDESIRGQALAAIDNASLVVCILDDLRPNIPFELGYAKAKGKPCILLKRNGAVVNVKKYFTTATAPEGLKNPPLDMDGHFSDLRDLPYRPYDHEDPDSPVEVIKGELPKNNSDGKPLFRRVLGAWIAAMKDGLGEQNPQFKPLFKYIRETRFNPAKPLFATRRRQIFRELVEQCAAAAKDAGAAGAKPEPVPAMVIELLTDLSPEPRLQATRKLLAKNPHDIRLRFSECLAAHQQAKEGRYKDADRCRSAVDAWTSFLQEWPQRPEAHYNYAILLKNLGRNEEAEKHYKRALEIDPDDAEAHYNYAILLQNLGRKKEAEKHYKRALEIDPEYAAAHYNYAILLEELGRKKEAEKHYKRALEIDPDYAKDWANLGRLYQTTSRPTEARRCYKRALKLGTLPDGGERVRQWLAELDEDDSAAKAAQE